MSTIKIKNDFGWQSVASVVEPSHVLAKDVNFYDYDGALVYSYTASEFLIHNMMPALPKHKGLKGQGWNWSIESALNYVSKYGRLNVGATYITDDGKTRFYISISDLAFMSLRIIFAVNGTVVVDWGDGNTETITGTSSDLGNSAVLTTNDHTYTSVGDYIITLDVDGMLSFTNMGSTYNNYGTLMPPISYETNAKRAVWGMLTKIETGKNIFAFGENSFREFYNLKTVTIPEYTYVYVAAFRYCDSLKALIVPIGIDVARAYAYDCHSINIIVNPHTIKEFRNDNTCTNDYCLKSFIIPDAPATLQGGMLSNCQCIMSMVIPDAVTTINANAFSSTSIHELHFTSTTPPTVANSNAFSNLPTACKIYVPTGSRSAYTSATNYPSSSTYTYIEE